MSLESFILQSVIAGIFATVVLDLWQRVLYAASGIPPANWGLIGRWFAHLPRGRLVHRPIADSAAVPGEAAIGWTMHYLVGLAYGFAYLGLLLYGFERPPSLLNGFIFGTVSVVIPWFLLQPCLGIGVMGRLTADPRIPTFNALTSHMLYGVALYGGARLAAGL
jgi:Protein of unknown function (DUF2938)